MTVSALPGDTATRFRYRAYGVELSGDFPLPGIPEAAGGAAARSIAVTARTPREVEELWSGAESRLHEAVIAGGAGLVVERGAAGDHLVRYRRHAFRLSPDLALLTCAPPAWPDAEWLRALLDWVAYSAAVLSGTQCLHASAVTLDAGVLALAAASGGGKTTLAAELVSAGAGFFCDDVLALSLDGGRVIAHPGAPFACLDGGRRELADRLGTTRGRLGEEIWVSVEHRASAPAPVAAVVVLDRRPDGPPTPEIRAADFVSLRALAIGFGAQPRGEEGRFALLAALAEQAPLLRLEASTSASPAALARSLGAHLEAMGAS